MTQDAPSQAASRPPRRHDLDAIRVVAFGLLILYHLGMFYVPWDWHVNSQRPVEALQPLMWLTNPWRLSLLFLVSGAATRLLFQTYQSQGPGAAERLGGSRLLRLGLPLIFAMLVIVPPQTYYEVVQSVRDQALYSDLYHNPLTADFWLRYVTASGDWCAEEACLITPTWNHLWFVAYVLVYGLLAALFVSWLGPRLDNLSAHFDRTFCGIGLFVWPLLYLALIRLLLHPRFPVTHDLVQDLYTHALSFFAYGFGFFVVCAPRVTQSLKRFRLAFLILALASYGAFITYMTLSDGTPPAALKQAMRVVYAIDQWAFIAAILGYAAQYVTRPSRLLTYLGGGIFTYYILHQTLIVVAAAHIEPLGLALGFEMLSILGLTLIGCALGYEVARRIGPLGLLIGASPFKPKSELPAVSSPRQSVVTSTSSHTAKP